MKYIIKILFLVFSFFTITSCNVEDDCSNCADLTYDVRLVLKVNDQGKLNTSYKSGENEPDTDLRGVAFFIFNKDKTLNNIKYYDQITPGNLSLMINNNAEYIYAVTNFTNNPAVFDRIKHEKDIKGLLDTMTVNFASASTNDIIMQTGFSKALLVDKDNPYLYTTSLTLRPVISQVNITLSSNSSAVDYKTAIDSMEVFLLNTRSRISLFDSIESDYINGKYDNIWNGTTYLVKQDAHNDINLIKKDLSLNVSKNKASFYVPSNFLKIGDYSTLVVLRVVYKMQTIGGAEDRFVRYFTVDLKKNENGYSIARGTKYNITFNLSGKYLGALSPLTSYMNLYSPMPTKSTYDNWEHVSQDKYSVIKQEDWIKQINK